MSLLRWPRHGVTGSPSIHVEGHMNWKVISLEGDVLQVRCECGWTSSETTQNEAAEEVLHHLKALLNEGHE